MEQKMKILFRKKNKNREGTAKPITPCHCEADTPDKEIFDCEHNKFLSGLILFWQVMKVLGDIV